MKNSATILLVIGVVLLALIAGFFLGRNSTYSPIVVSKLPTKPQSSGLLNINVATHEELMTLPGIGEVLSQRIIDYRDANGPFSRLSDLTFVDGIGLDILEKIMDYATVQEE